MLLTSESLLRLALSFVLALALWLYVTGKQDPDIALTLQQPLPIGVSGLNGSLIVTNDLGSAHVRYRTTNPQIQVSGANFRTFVDLLNMKPGTHRNVPVVCESDPGITCASVTPQTLTVVVDVRTQAHIPVVARVIGQPAPGYYVARTQFFPSTVTVTGPQSLSSQVTGASVDLNLSGLSSSLNATFRPTLVGNQGIPITGSTRLAIDPEQVTVQVDIKALSSFKPLPVLISLKGQPKSGFGVTGVTVTPPEVTVQGSPSKLKKLSSVSTRPVTISGRRGPFSSQVPLILPQGVTSNTRSVTVRTKIQAVDATSSLEVGVTVEGVLNGLSATANPKKVAVTVIGPANIIRQAAGQIQVIVNMTGYGTGSFQMTPVVTVPPEFHVTNTYPNQVTVKVVSPFGR